MFSMRMIAIFLAAPSIDAFVISAPSHLVARPAHVTRNAPATAPVLLAPKPATLVKMLKRRAAPLLAAIVLSTQMPLASSSIAFAAEPPAAVRTIAAPVAAPMAFVRTRGYRRGTREYLENKAAAAPSKVWSMEEVPRKGRIMDYAGVIDERYKRAIAKVIYEAEERVGSEVVVVTLDSVEGGKPAMKRFATDLFNRWGVGSEERNNGVLVLFSQGDRRIEIAVGKSLNGKVSTAWTEEMLKEYVVPKCRRGDYGAGILQAVKRVDKRLDYKADPLEFLAVIGQLAFLGLGAAFGGGGDGSGGDGGSDFGGGSSDGGGGGGADW